jgi:hypothetical protein
LIYRYLFVCKSPLFIRRFLFICKSFSFAYKPLLPLYLQILASRKPVPYFLLLLLLLLLLLSPLILVRKLPYISPATYYLQALTGSFSSHFLSCSISYCFSSLSHCHSSSCNRAWNSLYSLWTSPSASAFSKSIGSHILRFCTRSFALFACKIRRLCLSYINSPVTLWY